MSETVPEVCGNCGVTYWDYLWSADDELWNEINGSPNGYLCLSCFLERAVGAEVRPYIRITRDIPPAAHNADAALREACEAGDVLAQAVHDYLWAKITGLDLANAIDDYHAALSALRSPATGEVQ